jgi:putative flippase GtrA
MKIMPEAGPPSTRDKTGASPPSAGDKKGAGARYAAAMTAVVRRLPFGLDRIVAPNLLGFAVINLCTFSLDLALLTALHGGLHWPVPVSITLSYVIASGLSYLLNRSLNFRSHGALATQTGVYAVVITVNYLAWILGVGAGLAALGVNYQLARIMAGLCEGAYMYVAMRWLVFRDVRSSVRSRS